MRTTLKRGTGRDERNGHGTLTVSPFTSVTRYQAPRRGPLRLLGKIFLWLLVAVLVAAGALAGGAWLFFTQSVVAVRPSSPGVKEAQKILETPAPGEPAVAIVIGYDRRYAGVDKSVESRSDTVMLVRADPRDDVVSMLSFPRDLVVEHPGCGRQPAFTGRINEAFTYCGPRGTLETVKALTGIPINYMITVNFRAFTEIVDRLGGVYMDVDRRYFNDNSGVAAGATYATIDLHPGYQQLTGRQALDYVRYRHTDSDLYRVVRQQEFVKAFKQKIASTWSLLQIPGVVSTITENVEVAKGGSKPLERDEVLSYAKLIYGLPTGNFQQLQIEGLSGYAELAATEGSVDEAVQAFMNPDAGAAERATAAATRQRPRQQGPQAPEPESVSVEILNGNGIAGAASDAAFRLSERGYRVENGGNADNFDYFETRILYDAASADSKRAAEALATAFGDAEAVPAPAGAELSTTVRVIVGQTFAGTLTPERREPAPEYQPPKVVKDASSAAPLVAQARRRAGFQLLVPTVREETSSLDSVEPSRLYKIGDEKGLRLTYQTGGGEYWGIQQTSWDDPPILGEPSVTRRIGDREYELYFSGTKLHMVAFRENESSYWVVNTLLNRLTNETMLAIAQGLRAR